MLDLTQIQSFYPEEIRPFRTNILREYLQHKILESLFRSRHGAKLSFMGGTCIHLIHGSPRFSEDLDFDNADITPDEFGELAESVRKDLELEGYTVELRSSFKGAFRAFFRFPAILLESGLTGDRKQKLLIQVDSEPQRFDYEPDDIIINKFDVFCRIHAVPADVLLAQKFCCILSRPRPMGRDFYDAVFLMGKAHANMAYLRAKLGIEGTDDLKDRLLARGAELDLRQLATDIEPFVIRAQDADRVLLFPEYIAGQL